MGLEETYIKKNKKKNGSISFIGVYIKTDSYIFHTFSKTTSGDSTLKKKTIMLSLLISKPLFPYVLLLFKDHLDLKVESHLNPYLMLNLEC